MRVVFPLFVVFDILEYRRGRSFNFLLRTVGTLFVVIYSLEKLHLFSFTFIQSCCKRLRLVRLVCLKGIYNCISPFNVLLVWHDLPKSNARQINQFILGSPLF